MFYLLLLIIAIPSFFSLLNPWYFSMHDTSHVVRLFLLDQAVHQGYFYPRWVDMFGFGFGYPMFNFYPPFAYYVGLVFRLLGASYVWSVKLTFITGFLLASAGMYLWMRRKIEKLPALVSATLYTYVSYHAVNAYVRGALAEFFCMAVLPFLFWSLDLIAEKPSIKRLVFFASTLAVLITTHPLVAFPSVIFIGIYVLSALLSIRNKLKYAAHVVTGGLLGLGLSAFFWLPAMLERKFTLVKTLSVSELFDYKLHFVEPIQFWFSSWGFGGSVAGLSDGLSFQLGKIPLALAGLSLALFIVLLVKKKIKALRATRYSLYAGLFVLSLFLSTSYSKFIWENISLLQYLQFPWRLLTFAGLFLSVLGGYGVYFVFKNFQSIDKRNLAKWAIASVIIVGTVFQYHKYFKPESYIQKTDKELTTFEEVAWEMSSRTFDFVPEGVPLKKTQYGNSVVDINRQSISYATYQTPNSKIKVQQTESTFNVKGFRVETPKPFTFTLNTFNFPGWTAYIDGGRLPISYDNRYKLISVQVPTGVHNLEFGFEDTPVRKWSNVTSLVSFLGVVLLLSVGKLKKSKS